LHRDAETFTQQESLPARPATVFKALTDSKVQTVWTNAKATGQGSVGSKFTMFNGFITGQYLDLQPGRRILEEWRTRGWPRGAPPSIVEITLEEKGEETTVITVQSLVPSGRIEAIASIWRDRYWRLLRTYLENMNGG